MENSWRYEEGGGGEGGKKKTVKVKCQECREKVGGGVGARP